MSKVIKIAEKDNVVVAVEPIAKGEVVDGVEVLQDIPQGHKVALMDILKGNDIVKYGDPIGHATQNIKKGEHVHTQNLKTNLSDNLEYKYEPEIKELEKKSGRVFMGYRRPNGSVGIRNEIWIVPTVGCMNSVVKEIEKECQKLIEGGVENIFAFNHPYGCSQMGDDQDNTRQILANLIEHPNAAGVLVLGLGCENSNIEEIKKHMKEPNASHIRYLVGQEVEDEVATAVEMIKDLVSSIKTLKREEISCSELKIGLKCGGSDGLSGITANPTVGEFSDRLVEQGGTTILTEVPEMFGAEVILMNRCESEEVFKKTVKLINDFKDYFRSYDQTIYENPSPGNKAGGISSLEDKSLGCTQKSGTAKVVDVLNYGDRLHKKGLNLLSSPGNDLVAATALAAAGCQMVLFTTGRGTPFASPVPTMKISSNTPLAEKKKNWIDFNTGEIVKKVPISEMGDRLFDYVVAVASGEKVKSEEAGYHDLAIFKNGVTL